MRTHLSNRLQKYPHMETFVYAHTHQIEVPSTIKISMTRSVTVANDGAFQRLVSEAGYRKRTKALNLSVGEGLAKIPLEALAPCYGFVYLPANDEARTPRSQQWFMDETDSAAEYWRWVILRVNKACRAQSVNDFALVTPDCGFDRPSVASLNARSLRNRSIAHPPGRLFRGVNVQYQKAQATLLRWWCNKDPPLTRFVVAHEHRYQPPVLTKTILLLVSCRRRLEESVGIGYLAKYA